MKKNRRILNKNTKYNLVVVLSIILIFLIWVFLINRWVPKLYWPSLSSVIDSVVQLRSTLLINMAASVIRTILGYLLGCSLGIAIAYLMSWNKWFDALITPYISVLRPIPAYALIPFFILWFGIGDTGKILMIAMGTFVIMVISTLEGIHQLDRLYIKAAKILGASKWQIYKTIIFPGSLPAIMGGLRVNATLAFGIMVASEYLGAKSGLGLLIITARRTMETDVMLLAIIIIGTLAFIFDKIVLQVGRYVTRWMPSE